MTSFVEFLDLENIGVAVGIFFLCIIGTEILWGGGGVILLKAGCEGVATVKQSSMMGGILAVCIVHDVGYCG